MSIEHAPTLSRAQVREIDRRAVDDYGMTGLVLMENAGRGTADVLCELGIDGPVVVCCGKGNNAGDGFVIARHLDLRGFDVGVHLWASPDSLKGDAAANYNILAKSHVPIKVFDPNADPAHVTSRLSGADWIVDALLGTGAVGDPQPPFDWAIEAINGAPGKKLAVDLPSGLDCDSGAASRFTVVAHHTCTFVAMKRGLLAPGAVRYTGRVHVCDIGVPRKLLAEFGLVSCEC
jgi:NAD(P)H-hydrate epimerase